MSPWEVETLFPSERMNVGCCNSPLQAAEFRSRPSLPTKFMSSSFPTVTTSVVVKTVRRMSAELVWVPLVSSTAFASKSFQNCPLLLMHSHPSMCTKLSLTPCNLGKPHLLRPSR